MRKTLTRVIPLLAFAFLFRDRLMEMIPYGQGISAPALVIAAIVGGFGYLIAYVLVTTLEIRDPWWVFNIVILGGIPAKYLGHWLGGFEPIGEFWGGVVTGFTEAAILAGAIYGASEVWQGKKE